MGRSFDQAHCVDSMRTTSDSVLMVGGSYKRCSVPWVQFDEEK